MGRPALGLKYVQVGLREECLAEIDGLVGNGGRAEFIRDAVDAALGQKKNSIIPAGADPSDLLKRIMDDRPPSPGAARRAAELAVARSAADEQRQVQAPDASAMAKPKGRDLTGDYQRVLTVLGDRTRAVRPLAADLGWEQMRLERLLEKMRDAGLVAFEGGVASRIV